MGETYGVGNVASMTTALASLRTDDINTDIERFTDVLRVTNHVHDRDAGCVKLVNGLLGWNAWVLPKITCKC